MVNVEVKAHNVNGALVAIEVRAPHATLGAAMATAHAAWPEHAHFVDRVAERGDFYCGREAIWFFDGPDGEEIAGL